MTTGGKSLPVYVITDAQITSGAFTVLPGPAYRVASLATTTRGVTSGVATPVYVVDAAEAARRGVVGGKPLPVSDVTSVRPVEGLHKAIPVYVELGTLGSGGGSTPTPGNPNNVNAWNPDLVSRTDIPSDYPTHWSTITGMNSSISSQSGGWFPNVVSGEAGLLWSGPAFDIASNDMWMEFGIVHTFAAADFLGFGLRVSNSAYTLYGFWCDNASYAIYKMIAGSRTDLDTGSLPGTPTAGDTMRAEVIGTTLRYYLNDTLIGSATDSGISSGYYGIIGDGVAGGSVTRICDIRAGVMPFVASPNRNLYFANQWTYNSPIGTPVEAIVDSVGNSPQNCFDASYGTSYTDTVNRTHYIEFYFTDSIHLNAIAIYGPSTSDLYDWVDVDVYGKVEAGDAWTKIGDNLTLDNPGATGWKSASLTTEMVARYVRVECITTANAFNFCGCAEMIFRSNVPV